MFLGAIALLFGTVALALIIRQEPNGYSFLIPTIVAIGLFIGIIRPVRLIFDAPSKTAELIATSLMGRKRTTYVINPDTRVEIDPYPTPNSPKTRMVINLPTGQSSGRFFISHASTSPTNVQMAAILNDWLDSARLDA